MRIPAAFPIVIGCLISSLVTADTTPVMGALRAHLDRVQKTAPPVDSPDLTDMPSDLESLVGLPRSEIRRGLGDASLCESASRPLSCDSADIWWYSFYKLTPTMRGGGLELVIKFDGEDRVKSAEWLHTQ